MQVSVYMHFLHLLNNVFSYYMCILLNSVTMYLVENQRQPGDSLNEYSTVSTLESNTDDEDRRETRGRILSNTNRQSECRTQLYNNNLNFEYSVLGSDEKKKDILRGTMQKTGNNVAFDTKTTSYIAYRKIRH